MGQQINLEAKIADVKENSLRVGSYPQPANEFTLLITNKGEQISKTGKRPPDFYLKCLLGDEEEALFLNRDEAENCTITVPYGWSYNRAFSRDDAGKDIFGLILHTEKTKLLQKDESLKVTLSHIISKTRPGKAILTFETDLLKDHPATLTLLKTESKASEPGIIYFISEPGAGTQNFPGDSVLLRWRTAKLEKIKLYPTGSEESPFIAAEGEEEGAVKVDLNYSSDVNYTLEGYSGNKRFERKLQIKVLQPGWYDVKNTIRKGHPAYPEKGTADYYDLEPALLLNANEVKLYGIFRYTFQGRKRALLLETRDPFGNWKFETTSVPDEEGYIPEGFSTSPGVYFDDKIWLIGGSQIDRDQCSNGIWRLDPVTHRWEDFSPGSDSLHWKSRMGHAVVVFENRIWVIGGLDEAGNALNDIWALDAGKDGGNKIWTCLQEDDSSEDLQRWKGRCLFSAAVLNKKIWIYGGAAAPFSRTLYDDVWSAGYKAGALDKWEQQKGPQPDANFRAPIASCMQVFDQRLYLFAKFSTLNNYEIDTVEARAFCLETTPYYAWKRILDEHLQDWGGNTTSSCQLITCRKRMLIARTLSYETINPVMKIYVPPLK